MPLAGFTFIEQYRSLAKDLEQQATYDMLGFDQEVPQSRFIADDLDMKPQIKLEPDENNPDIYSFMMENILSSGSDSSTTFSDTASFKSSCTMDNSNKFTPTLSSSSSPSPYLSTSPAPMLSSASTTSPSTMSGLTTAPHTQTMSSLHNDNFLTTKTTTFVTELGGSGCTVVSNTDFLTDTTSCALPPMSMQEDSLEYTDLDKQPTSFYDDLGPFSHGMKPAVEPVISDESNSVPLEEAVIMMRNVIQTDSDNLNIPYDPHMWTPEHASKWLSWVCQKNRVPDVSQQLYGVDGPALCSISPDTFSSHYGDSGINISNELELWKAANSCFPNQTYGARPSDISMHQHQHLHNPYMESPQTFSLTPCVSPAPSTCSSSHDSTGSTVSTHSDHSDDESGYSSISSHPSSSGDNSSYRNRLTGKLPTGRGHKQTIHLWQFLKELLVSKENHGDCIRWLDRKAGVFKIEDSKKVAYLWGARKNRPAMNYDKLSRSVRQYYKKGIIKKTEQSKRLVYQFCPEYM